MLWLCCFNKNNYIQGVHLKRNVAFDDTHCILVKVLVIGDLVNEIWPPSSKGSVGMAFLCAWHGLV